QGRTADRRARRRVLRHRRRRRDDEPRRGGARLRRARAGDGEPGGRLVRQGAGGLGRAAQGRSAAAGRARGRRHAGPAQGVLDGAAAARAETASRVIDELRVGALRGTEELTRTATRFGLRLDEPHAAAVFSYDGPNRRTWSTALSWLEMPVRQENDKGWTVLAGDLRREISRIRVRLQGMVGDGTVLAATGPTVTDPRETARSFRDAEIVLGLLRRRPGETELLHSDLGLAQLLLAVPPEHLRAFVEQQLGPILDRPELILTLDAWLATRGSRATVAELLHLHRNSVGYRVGQLRQLLGADPLDPETSHRLRAALTARDLLDVFTHRTP